MSNTILEVGQVLTDGSNLYEIWRISEDLVEVNTMEGLSIPIEWNDIVELELV